MSLKTDKKSYPQRHKSIMSAFVIFAVIVVVVPLAIILVWSFSARWAYPDLIPQAFSLRGYESIMDARISLWDVIGTSAMVTVPVCLLSIIVGTLAAQALALYEFPGKSIIDFLVYLPRITPTVVFGIGIHVFYISIGLGNSIFGVILAQLTVAVPYAVKMMANATNMLGKKVMEQAVVLGLSPFRAFFQVSFKLLFPTMISAACMVFTVSFGDFFLTFIMGGGKVATFATIVVPMISSSDVNMASTYAVFYVAFSFIFFMALEWLSNRILKDEHLDLM